MPELELTPSRRSSLELLAGSADGCTEAQFLAQGFTRNLLTSLILNWLVTAQSERVTAGGRAIEVRRIKVTEAGR